MAPFLDQAINLALQDPTAARAFMDQHSSEITSQLAQEAHDRFLNAAQAQQWSYAMAAASISSSLYLRLGQRYEGLRNYFYLHQTRYLAASSEEEYQDIRETAIQLISYAEEISALDVAFEAATLAANCSYFTADLMRMPAEKERWLRLALNDLILASGYGPHAKGDGLEQFVSLLTGFSENFTQLVPTPDSALQIRLGQLTQAVEQFVPEDFQFQRIGDWNKTVHSARWLAVLSRRFGNSDVARRRLEFAAKSPR
jgi:hypothetical protein